MGRVLKRPRVQEEPLIEDFRICDMLLDIA